MTLNHLCKAAAPIEFEVDYQIWGFEPVGCVGAPSATGSFSTRECTNLDAYFGKFTAQAPAGKPAFPVRDD